MKEQNSINLLIKPTNLCNLQCKYCFNDKKIDEASLSIDQFRKLIELVTREVTNVQIVWHGGEPTLAGIEFYRKAFNSIHYYEKIRGVKFSQSIQTNCISLSVELIELLIENNVSIGTSYDGLYNELTRGGTNLYLESLEHLKKYKIFPGAICVITKQTLPFLKEIYNDFLKRNQAVNFRPIIFDGAANNFSYYFEVTAEEYIEKLYDLFEIWIKDEKCLINIQPFITYLQLYKTKSTGVCVLNSCIGKWFCIEPNGDITPCNRSFPCEYTFGSINSIEKFSDLYISSGMNYLLKNAINRRNKCKNECEFFEYCKGGCNHEALVQGNISDNGGFSCLVFKGLFGKIKEFLDKKSDLDLINPMAKKILDS